MKIVVLDGYTENPGDLSWEGFENLGDLVVHDRVPTDVKSVIRYIGDADIVITNKTPLAKEVFDACSSIRYVGVLATGYNVVDTITAKEKGIPVTNIPIYGTQAVAQYVFALLLDICHHVRQHSDAVKDGEWKRRGDFCFWDYPLIELAGKSLGIIGFGRIGQAVANIAVAFGMKVVVNDTRQDAEIKSENISYVSIDDLYKKSDIISLHCPLFPSTKGIINKDSIAKMKDGVIIINTSRGPLIVEEDLKAALISGKVSNAAVDVVSSEPIQDDNPLFLAPNLIITPHIAWAPKESRKRLMDMAVANLEAFINNSPVNVVNA